MCAGDCTSCEGSAAAYRLRRPTRCRPPAAAGVRHPGAGTGPLRPPEAHAAPFTAATSQKTRAHLLVAWPDETSCKRHAYKRKGLQT